MENKYVVGYLHMEIAFDFGGFNAVSTYPGHYTSGIPVPTTSQYGSDVLHDLICMILHLIAGLRQQLRRMVIEVYVLAEMYVTTAHTAINMYLMDCI